MKGFKDSNNKFHPITQSKGVRKSRDQQVKTQGIKVERKARDRSETRTYKVWSFENAPPEVMTNILDKWQNKYAHEFGEDGWYADNDGILYDTRVNFAGYEALDGNIPKYWDLDPYGYIQYPNLKVTDEKKLANYLGIPKELLSKIQFDFLSERGNKSTELQFRDINGNTIDLESSLPTKRNEFQDINFWLVDKEDLPTKPEWNKMKKASEKWNELMEMSLKHLRDEYEYTFTKEFLKDTAESNDYKFTEDGSIER